MSNRDRENPRSRLWEVMARQFLDNEVRDGLPEVARIAVELGLSEAEVRDVWLNEVTPAVGFNLRCVAGEWAGWDRAWLIRRIRRRRRCSSWPVGRMLGQLLRVRVADGLLESIVRLMVILATAPARERVELTRQLETLAGHFFHCDARRFTDRPVAELHRLRAIWGPSVEAALRPALAGGNASKARERVESALRREQGGCLRRRRDTEIRRAKAELVALLDRVMGYVEQSRDFDWSSWTDSNEALRELRAARATVLAGDMPLDLYVFFLPTGDLQEVSLQCGWAEDYLELAAQFDTAWGQLGKLLPVALETSIDEIANPE